MDNQSSEQQQTEQQRPSMFSRMKDSLFTIKSQVQEQKEKLENEKYNVPEPDIDEEEQRQGLFKRASNWFTKSKKMIKEESAKMDFQKKQKILQKRYKEQQSSNFKYGVSVGVMTGTFFGIHSKFYTGNYSMVAPLMILSGLGFYSIIYAASRSNYSYELALLEKNRDDKIEEIHDPAK